MSRIPGPVEFNEWKADYKRRYAAPIKRLGYDVLNAFNDGYTSSNDSRIPLDKAVPLDAHDEAINRALSIADMRRVEAAEQAFLEHDRRIGQTSAYGYDAGRAGKPATDNPYEDRSDEFYSWYRYWLSGNKDFH